MAPGTSARALAPDGRNGGTFLGDGDVVDLVDAHPEAAILGKIRPDLLVLDMDGAADWFDEIEDAAAAVGAVRVYLASSGSPGSLHVAYAPPTVAARRALVAQVQALSVMADGVLDPRSPEEWLRLPGAPSLKAGCGPVQPVEPAGDGFVPVEASRALSEAQEALQARRRDRAALGVKFNVREFDVRDGEDHRHDLERHDHAGDDDRVVDRLSLRTSYELDDEARHALSVPCPKGQDATLHALRAAWHLWRCGFRAWDEVAAIVMRAPALARWRRGGRPEAARRWRMEASTWASWRPELNEEAMGRIADARASAGLLPPDLEAILLAVLEWMEKSGRIDEIPIAVRDLIVWGVSGSVGSAHRALESLELGGVLVRARGWEDGPAEEAVLWTLQSTTLWQIRVEGAIGDGIWNIDTHPLPVGFERLHPVWISLGHTSRRLLTQVHLSPGLTTPQLAEVLKLSSSTVRGLLPRLEGVGMVLRTRQGRSTLWSPSGSPWSSLPVVVEAEAAHLDRVRQVGAERAAWRESLASARSARATEFEEAPLPSGPSASAATTSSMAMPTTLPMSASPSIVSSSRSAPSTTSSTAVSTAEFLVPPSSRRQDLLLLAGQPPP